MDERHQPIMKDRNEAEWDSLADMRRPSARRLGKSSRFSIGSILMIVGALGAHGALGYFGYGWIRSQSAPTYPAFPDEVKNTVTPRQGLPPAVQKPLAPKEISAGKLQWTRKEGMTIQADPADNWKCAGGYYYSIIIDANGSKVIELVKVNKRPLRCED